MTRPVDKASDRTWNQLCNLDELRILCQHFLSDYDNSRALQTAASTAAKNTLAAIRENVSRPATEQGGCE